MLQPKRTKYRKTQKGRNRGLAQVGNRVSFGEYGLKADHALRQAWRKALDPGLPRQACHQETR
jgi:ribosomal protein L16/L10AE